MTTKNNKHNTPPLNRSSQTAKNIALAEQAAHKQLTEGTASSQVISHYLKLASRREEVELLKLEKEIKLLDAKVDDVKSGTRIEELYQGVIDAIQSYGPTASLDYDP